MIGNMSLEMIFLIVIGVAVFVAGVTMLRSWMRGKKTGGLFGTVLQSSNVRREDSEGNLIQNYYELTMRITWNKKTENKKIRSTIQYEKGEEVPIYYNGREYVAGTKETSAAMALFAIALGLGIIFFPVAYQQVGEKAGFAVLAFILLLVGCGLMVMYLKDRNRKLTPIEGSIKEILYYKTGEGKKLVKPTISYYPIISCEIDGKEKVFQSKYNSSTKTTYKVGSKVGLYWDEEKKDIFEKKAGTGILVMAVVFLAFAALGFVSTLFL